MSNLMWIGGGLLLALVIAYLTWDYIKPLFSDSETLLWGRLQLLVGVLMATDYAPIIPARYMPYYVIFNAIVIELVRRNRTVDPMALAPTLEPVPPKVEKP